MNYFAHFVLNARLVDPFVQIFPFLFPYAVSKNNLHLV